jgi:hypothetical protein
LTQDNCKKTMSAEEEEIIAEAAEVDAEPEVPQDSCEIHDDSCEIHDDIRAIIFEGKGLPASRVSEFKTQMAKKKLSLSESTPAALALATRACAVYSRKKERAAQASARQREALKSLKKNDAESDDTVLAADVPVDVPAEVPSSAQGSASLKSATLFVPVKPAEAEPKPAKAVSSKVSLFRQAAPSSVPKKSGSLSGLFA